jgi:FGGY-family pentulose kinase
MGLALDLADFLLWRATGRVLVSACTVTCKWTYLAHEKRWDEGYFRAIGLGDLADEGFARIGTEIVPPGTAIGAGLTERAAADLGLLPGTAVAAALIDAHSGGIGTLGVEAAGIDPAIGSRLAYIFGTSACSMASAAEPIFVDGVWGPYFSAMVPGLWLTEGGQSAAGAALDHLVLLHPEAPAAGERAAAEGVPLTEWLTRRAAAKAGDASAVIELAGRVHVVPEFLGNRSPFADPDARAVIAGLGLERDEDSLIALYVAGLAGIGYGLRQLLERLRERGIPVASIVASGGAARNPVVCQILADATATPVLLPGADEPVLRGAAMLASVAATTSPDLPSAMATMSGPAVVLHPAGSDIAAIHLRRYAAFEGLQAAARRIRDGEAENP